MVLSIEWIAVQWQRFQVLDLYISAAHWLYMETYLRLGAVTTAAESCGVSVSSVRRAVAWVLGAMHRRDHYAPWDCACVRCEAT